LRRGDAASRLAVMDMIVRLATTTGGVGSKASIARVFGADLAELTRQGDLLTREAAARALGQANPDPAVAVPALSELMESQEMALKLAASDGFGYLMKVVTFLATRNHAPNMVEATRGEVVKAGQQVIPAAARGLRSTEPQVRRRCAGAIAQTAEALCKLLPRASAGDAEEIADFRRQQNADRAELLPLLAVLREQMPALTRGLSDSDGDVRMLARRALEDMTSPSVMLLEQTGGMAAQPSRSASSAAQGPALGNMQGTVQQLAEGLKDEEPRSRRTVMDVLETLGAAAAPAAPTLAKALSDPDPFVRWAAARTLGKIAPAAADVVVPALAAMLRDTDLDLRVAAAAALEHYGKAAGSVVPELIRALGATDAEMRVSVIRALGAIGAPDAGPALPGLTAAVSDPEPRVQEAAAKVLGDLGALAGEAAEPLRKALQTGTPAVQKAAGEALLKIMRLEK
ncbi:MAG TPA: HEAT repeat domain-containing protein, partial [Gemmataceae bacterium]|nr:HEAT repeat domain-containing protein [Gemmataceae bacterium]